MHTPVMVREVVELLAVRSDGRYIDGTLGGGGHARAIAERLGPEGRLLGIDRDAEALVRARAALQPWVDRVTLAQGAFADLADLAAAAGLARVDGIVLDLGMSSLQLDDPARGFSFQRAGPLDMRMDRRQTLTAEALVRTLTEDALAELIGTLGEERWARRIARAIARARERAPLTTTLQLAEVVAGAIGRGGGRLHPATRTFQALRMAVNAETDQLARGLEAALNLLPAGGRLAVLTYHSLEDRPVKHCFARHVGHWESLPAGGQCRRGAEPKARWVNRKPLIPSDAETADNPRARSAKLRVIERME